MAGRRQAGTPVRFFTLRALVTLAATVAFAVAGTVAVAGGAGAADRSQHYYVALGDSLAAGVQPDATGRSMPTDRGYVDDLYAQLSAADSKLDLVNLGCPGETTTSMIDGGICAYDHAAAQLDAAARFLHAHDNHVSLVTVDIGANNIDQCVSGGTLNQQCVSDGLATIAVELPKIVDALRAAAPEVRIVAMNYYDPFLAAWLSGPAGQALAAQSVQLLQVLNGLEANVYASGDVEVADVAAAFSTTDFTTQVQLPGVGTVPLNVARVCQWTWMCAPPPVGPNIHANDAGYHVIADTLAARVS
jgi:lysophospholipase L1-like esterase